jgi:hypothetical protein
MRKRDVWNTTIYHRAIRKKIGEALSAGYDLSQPLPVRIGTLLSQLDEPGREDVASEGHPSEHTNRR